MTDVTDSTKNGDRNRALTKVVIGLICVAAIALIGLLGFGKFRDMGSARTEIDAQKQEQEECKKRLASFYAACTRYAADHKGQFPSNFAQLTPKYIADPALLTCPTAKRWLAKGAQMESGRITLKGKDYPVTYRFLMFTASFPIEQRKHGDKTVLVDCDAHQEGMYRAVFHKAPHTGAFSGTERASLPDEVNHTNQLVLLKNGTVAEQTEDQ